MNFLLRTLFFYFSRQLICSGSDVSDYLRGIDCASIPSRIPFCLRSPPAALRPPMLLRVPAVDVGSPYSLAKTRLLTVRRHVHASAYRNVVAFCRQWERRRKGNRKNAPAN